MRFPLLAALLLAAAAFPADTPAQRNRPKSTAGVRKIARPAEIGATAVVIDETLSVLRLRPSLFAEPVQRMRLGRTVKILGVREADGVKFFRVEAPPATTGWVQADAVFGRFRTGDEERLADLIQASRGFEKIELAASFFELFPSSRFRPSVLLLFGDLVDEAAVKLSRDAGRRLDRGEMAASRAPMHSYYLNFAGLDRYRKLGAVFLFNSSTRTFHYDGASWKEIIRKFSDAPEAAEARKRLDSLKLRLEARQ